MTSFNYIKNSLWRKCLLEFDVIISLGESSFIISSSTINYLEVRKNAVHVDLLLPSSKALFLLKPLKDVESRLLL